MESYMIEFIHFLSNAVLLYCYFFEFFFFESKKVQSMTWSGEIFSRIWLQGPPLRSVEKVLRPFVRCRIVSCTATDIDDVAIFDVQIKVVKVVKR
jgi:hypothetical protein